MPQGYPPPPTCPFVPGMDPPSPYMHPPGLNYDPATHAPGNEKNEKPTLSFRDTFAHAWFWIPYHQMNPAYIMQSMPQDAVTHFVHVAYNGMGLLFITAEPRVLGQAIHRLYKICEESSVASTVEERNCPSEENMNSQDSDNGTVIAASFSDHSELFEKGMGLEEEPISDFTPPQHSPRPMERRGTAVPSNSSSRRKYCHTPRRLFQTSASEAIPKTPTKSSGREQQKATFNIYINRSTYLLLKSKNCTPLTLLKKLTHTTFTASLRPGDARGAEDGFKARICITGSRSHVHHASKLLTEVMIFIGNRFGSWFDNLELDGSVRSVQLDSESEPLSSTPESQEDVKNIVETSIPRKDKAKKSGQHESPKDVAKMVRTSGDTEMERKYRKEKNCKMVEMPTLDVLLIPEAETGKIIGCKGVKIRQIEKTSGAFVQMTKAAIPGVEDNLRGVFLVGTTNAIEQARKIICETVQFSVEP